MMTKELYQNFIGMDIGKFEIVVGIHGSKKIHSFENNQEGWKQFVKSWKDELKQALIVLETTGGYELGIILYLNKLKYKVYNDPKFFDHPLRA